ncbi:hypothetical protein [Stenoxybacter acetivorans]|uniref:hypothetical protein n=1 Tax=Stenoxybacter acetivorans TaxID=422441 RepID=UPI0005642F80|nr:hypothetical protein [Stenoxybacter acetivorans]
MDKNPKPKNISFEEFSRKNRAGFCWKDHKTYTQEELRKKAILSYLESQLKMKQMAVKGKRYSNRKNYFGYSIKDCDDKWGCRIFLINKQLVDKPNGMNTEKNITNRDDLNKIEIIKILNKNLNTNQLKPTEITLQNLLYIQDVSSNSTSNDYIIIDTDVGFNYSVYTFQEDFSVLSKAQFEVISRKKPNKWDFDVGDGIFSRVSYIPSEININDYGVGNYYFYIKSFGFGENRNESKIEEWFFIDNCGNLLHRPYYRSSSVF